MKGNVMTKTNKRFSGILGEEYSRLLRALPHYLDMQDEMAMATNRGFPPRTKKPRLAVDLGCGSGITTVALHKLLNHAAVLGVDSEPKMLRQYRQTVSRLSGGLGIQKPIESDILSFLKRSKDGSWDAVVSGFVLHNLPKPLRRRIIREIYRALKPGGSFVLGDKIAQDDQEEHDKSLMHQFGRFVEAYNSSQDYGYGIGWIEHYVRDNQSDLKQTEGEVHESFTLAGFRAIKLVKRFGMDAIIVGRK